MESLKYVNYSQEERDRISKALNERLAFDEVSKRPGPRGQSLSYMEHRKVVENCNLIFGFDGWSSIVDDVKTDFVKENRDGMWECAVHALVRIQLPNGTCHGDLGTGTGKNRNRAMALSNAMKQAITDGRKRALRIFGPKLGGDIYDKEYLEELNIDERESKRKRINDKAPTPARGVVATFNQPSVRAFPGGASSTNGSSGSLAMKPYGQQNSTNCAQPSNTTAQQSVTQGQQRPPVPGIPSHEQVATRPQQRTNVPQNQQPAQASSHLSNQNSNRTQNGSVPPQQSTNGMAQPQSHANQPTNAQHPQGSSSTSGTVPAPVRPGAPNFALHKAPQQSVAHSPQQVGTPAGNRSVTSPPSAAMNTTTMSKPNEESQGGVQTGKQVAHSAMDTGQTSGQVQKAQNNVQSNPHQGRKYGGIPQPSSSNENSGNLSNSTPPSPVRPNQRNPTGTKPISKLHHTNLLNRGTGQQNSFAQQSTGQQNNSSVQKSNAHQQNNSAQQQNNNSVQQSNAQQNNSSVQKSNAHQQNNSAQQQNNNSVQQSTAQQHKSAQPTGIQQPVTAQNSQDDMSWLAAYPDVFE